MTFDSFNSDSSNGTAEVSPKATTAVDPGVSRSSDDADSDSDNAHLDPVAVIEAALRALSDDEDSDDDESCLAPVATIEAVLGVVEAQSHKPIPLQRPAAEQVAVNTTRKAPPEHTFVPSSSLQRSPTSGSDTTTSLSSSLELDAVKVLNKGHSLDLLSLTDSSESDDDMEAILVARKLFLATNVAPDATEQAKDTQKQKDDSFCKNQASYCGESDSDTDDELFGQGSLFDKKRRAKYTTSDADLALQLLLQEIGFTFKLYAHQFEAVRLVAGLVSSFPIPSNAEALGIARAVGKRISSKDSNGTRRRRLALQLTALEFSSRLRNNNEDVEDDFTHTLATKGMLLADEMGLGKTIEALAGAALRSAIMSCDPNKNHNLLPTLIVSPQDGIQNQWYETLVKSGVSPSSISVWGDTKAQSKKRKDRCFRDGTMFCSKKGTEYLPGDISQYYSLCTRYNIQSELQRLFKKQERMKRQGDNPKATTTEWDLIGKLRNQYRAYKGKEKNKYINKEEKETFQDCVARLFRSHHHSNTSPGAVPQFAFQTIIVDEAHFCKNVLAYWGLGLALLATKSRRTVLLTGTPYNNGPSDMTALMTYIDPSHAAAKLSWWEEAVSSSSNSKSHFDFDPGVANAVSEWRKAYLLRRTKDILLQKLPRRIRTEINVAVVPSELWIYQVYEGKFLKVLCNLRKEMEMASPEACYRARKAFEVMMACMACMRMTLVHPILLGGREATIHFSPSRRHLLKREERPNKCVFCSSNLAKMAEEGQFEKTGNHEHASGKYPSQKTHESHEYDGGLFSPLGAALTDMDLDDDQLNDDDFEDSDAISKKERELEEMEKGPVIPLGPEFCRASGSPCQHFAHKKCIEKHIKNGNALCPRCEDLKSRLHKKLTHNIYCQEIRTHVDDLNAGGFTASAKIEKAIEWFQTTVPKNDKAIFLSFFKGSLDLIEGILVSKFGINCARYDGDCKAEGPVSTSLKQIMFASLIGGSIHVFTTKLNHAAIASAKRRT